MSARNPEQADAKAVPDTAALLCDYLADRDTPCPGCGYNLKGLRNSVCPECSDAIQLQVGLVQPRILPFVGVISGLAAGAGAAFLWLVAAIVLSIAMRDWPPWPWLAVPALALLIEGGAMAWLMRPQGRVWFRRATSGRRSLAIVAAWAGTAAWFGTFLAVVLIRR